MLGQLASETTKERIIVKRIAFAVSTLIMAIAPIGAFAASVVAHNNINVQKQSYCVVIIVGIRDFIEVFWFCIVFSGG
jgi:hypothetical protein